MSFADLKRRSLTAGVLVLGVAVLLALAHYYCLGRVALLAFAFLVPGLSAWEFSHFSSTKSAKVNLFYCGICVFPALLVLIWSISNFGFCSQEWRPARGFGIAGLGCAVSLLIATTYSFAVCRDSLDQIKHELLQSWTAILLIGGGGSALVGLSGVTNIVPAIVWLLAVVCGNDIAAYFGGRVFGGAKLAEHVSPGKTISGSVAGLVAGVVIGVVLRSILPYSSLIAALLVSASVVLSAQVADLLESLLKRIAGVKDSGSILPGHGGVLDRVDALLGAAPILYAWLFLNSWW